VKTVTPAKTAGATTARKAPARKAGPAATPTETSESLPAEPATPPAAVAEGGLDTGAPSAVEDTTTAAASGPAAEAIPGRENGNNPEEAASMSPEDWATLARP
jgi:hypothetical protein